MSGKYSIAGGKVFDQSGSVVGKVDRSGKIVMFAQSVSETFDQVGTSTPVLAKKNLSAETVIKSDDFSLVVDKRSDAVLGAKAIPDSWGSELFKLQCRAADGFPLGDASLRENAVVWHEGNKCWYLITDIVLKSNPAHTMIDWATFDSEIALFKSTDFITWTYVGICIPAGSHGVASPAGASVDALGRVWVAHAVRTETTVGSSDVYVSRSAVNPEALPWITVGRPCKTGGADDDAGEVWGRDCNLHIFFRTTQPDPLKVGETDYAIMVTSSETPDDIGSYSTPVRLTESTVGVLRSQEGTAFFHAEGQYHIVTLDKNMSDEIFQNTHLVSTKAHGPYVNAGILSEPQYGGMTRRDIQIFATGHPTYAIRDDRVVGCVLTVYGTAAPDGGNKGALAGRVRLEESQVSYRRGRACVATLAVDQVLPAGSSDPLDFRGYTWGAYDPDLLFDGDGSAATLIIPADGVYQFNAGAKISGTFPAGTVMKIEMACAAREAWYGFAHTSAQAPCTTLYMHGDSLPVFFKKGDHVQFKMPNTTDAPVTFDHNITFTWLAVRRLG